MGSTAIVTCHWNPAGFNSLVKNWHTWRQSVSGLGVPVVSVELSYTGEFATFSEIKLTESPEFTILWQKEALLNIAIASLPSDVDRIIWADADILYDDQDWVQKVDEALDANPFVQCFSEARVLGKSGQVEDVVPGSVVAGETDWFRRTKPGYIWAARREIFPDGLYDVYIGGGADVGFLLAGKGAFCSSWCQRQGEALRRHWLRWGAGFYQRVKGRIGYVDATISHLYHGSQSNRKYAERDRNLATLGYDPDRHVTRMENGVLRWTEEATAALVEGSREYFVDRREDE